MRRSIGTEGKGYRIDIDRAEIVAGTKLPSAQKEKGAAPLYKVKTAVAAFCRLLSVDQGENVTMFTDISKFCTPHSVAWVLSCATHTQHARNMACCAATQRCNLRCFALFSAHFRDSQSFKWSSTFFTSRERKKRETS